MECVLIWQCRHGWGRRIVSSKSSGRADWARRREFLTARPENENDVSLSWDGLSQIVGGIPDSAARHYPQWWHGDRSHVRAWQAAGYIATQIQPGRSVTFRRTGTSDPAHRHATRRRENALSPDGGVHMLKGLISSETLLLIPCSKTKRTGGEPDPWESAPWSSALLAARRQNRAIANVDERRLMPAWRRYDGGFYATAEDGLREAVNREAPLLILSGGYGLLHPKEPIGYYNKVMRLSDWPAGLLEALLIGEARRRNVSSVVAFAAGSSDYAKLVRRTSWEQAGVDAFLVTIEGAGKGASGKVPRRLGQAFTCFWRGNRADRYPEGATVERLG